MRFDCSQPLSLCDCRGALYDHGTAGCFSSYRITVTNVSQQRNVRWSQNLCAILTFNKRAGHSEQCKSMWSHPPPIKLYWTEQLVTSEPLSNCLPSLFRLNNVSFSNVSVQSFLCGVLILSLWPLSCLYFRYNRKKLCCLGGLTLQLLSSSLVYSKTECVKWIPVEYRVRGKKEGKFQVLNMLKLELCSLVFNFEPKWQVSAARKKLQPWWYSIAYVRW